MIFDLTNWMDPALLLLRFVLGVIFIASGWCHARDPVARGKAIEMSPWFTFGLGSWELLGGLSIIFGIWAQIGAAMAILVMLGGLEKQIFVWHTPFFEGATGGWHYELLLLSACLVVLVTAGGAIAVVR